ncbi:hypothetical protein [Streptomyces sp. NPDC054804]
MHHPRPALLEPPGERRAHALAFSADGTLLAASTADGSAQVWGTARTRPAPTTAPAGDGPVLALGFTAAGAELHVATPHLPDRSVPLRAEESAGELCARADGGPTRAR